MGFGNGGDGVWTPGEITDAPIDSSCSGSSGSTALSATNASFTAGQQIFIHQSRGTGAGQYEVNYIASYSAGTITTLLPLSYTYVDSGSSQAQVLVLKQYSGVTTSGALTGKAWDGDVGGILAFSCSGKTSVEAAITAYAKGFRGAGTDTEFEDNYADQGEGTNAAGGTESTEANGNGGGGGQASSIVYEGTGGGGGGHGVPGSDGGQNPSGTAGGTKGEAAGSADLSTIVFGGAGGQGSNAYYNGGGGYGGESGTGGGIIIIFSKIFEMVAPAGQIISGGSNGGIGVSGTYASGGGGAGAGGSILIKCQSGVFGGNVIFALGGTGGAGSPQVGVSYGGTGGNGAVGRIRVEACYRTGLTNPAASEAIGGHNWCGSAAAIIG